MNTFELRDIFSSDLVFVDKELSSRDDVFLFVVNKLKDKKLIAEEQVADVISALKSRENVTSTGIGQEIAIPHIILNSAGRIFGCIFKSEIGINWQAIDGKPVKLIVFLFAPETLRQQYLRILAEVAQILNIPELRNRIIKSQKPTEIYRLLTKGYAPTFWEKHHRIISFGLGLVFIFLLAKLIFSLVKLPDIDIYHQLNYLRFNESQWVNKEILSVVLFFSMVLGTLLFFRYRVAFGGIALSLLLVAGVMDIETTVKYMSIPTILFIVCVMVLVKWFEAKGVFRFLVVKALKYFFNSPLLLFGALMFFSAILSGLINEVSAILITFGIAIEIARRTKVGIIPYLLGLVMATNIGSALTLIANPIGIYLAFAGKLTFVDFLKNSTVISILSVLFIIFIVIAYYRKTFSGNNVVIDIKEIEEKTEMPEHKELLSAVLTFVIFVILIVCHSFLEA
ncbi:MAG: SLC13 family permease, partial [candidate division WOR-3 bacterium]|nr:SLC13 family permease [candidate division WOR-3 bacterium]